MKKLLIAMLLILSLLCSLASAESGTAMDMSLFPASSSEFSPELAMLAVSSGAWFDAASAKLQLESMGFTVKLQQHYDKDPMDASHTSAFTVAKQTVEYQEEQRDLVFVTVRGTNGMEWISNFDFAPDTMGIGTLYAENFYKAAQDVLSALTPVLEGCEHPMLYVTGYSRGAAVANLLGVLLDAQMDPADVFVYTAATPCTVLNGPDTYANIYNIVNADDIVPSLPLPQWGFHRAGNDIVLKASEDSGSMWNDMFAMLLGVCPSAESYYNDRHSMSAPGLSEDGTTMWEFISSSLLQAAAGAAQPAAEADLQQQQMYMAMLANTDFGPMLQFMNMFGTDTASAGWVDQHMPAVYAALLGTLAQ